MMYPKSNYYNDNSYYDNSYDDNYHITHHKYTYEPFIGMFVLLFISFLLTCCSHNNQNQNLNQNLLKNNLPVIIITDLNNEICSICLEQFVINDKINKLDCEHMFHKECLDEWFINNNCPLCRKIII